MVILTKQQDERYEVTIATPYDEFLSVMRANPRTDHIDDHTMKSIFDYVVAKVKKRAVEEQQEQEHDARYAMDDLRTVLKRLDPPVALTDTWETVRPRVEKTKEYNALKSDSLRQSAFDKYMRRLKEKDSDRRDRSRRDTRDRDRERERDKDRERDRRDRRDDREYRNGHSDSHRRHRTRTRSPEHDSYAAERRRAQEDREARYRNSDSTGLSPPHRRDREREADRYNGSRRGSGDYYGRERREREVERERSYIPRGDPAASRADPRERSVSELDYGDSTGARTTSARRRRESDASSVKRDTKVCLSLLSSWLKAYANLYSALATLHVPIVSPRLPFLNPPSRRKSVLFDLEARRAKLRRTRSTVSIWTRWSLLFVDGLGLDRAGRSSMSYVQAPRARVYAGW